MKFKKLLATLLGGGMVLSGALAFAACGDKDGNTKPEGPETITPPAELELTDINAENVNSVYRDINDYMHNLENSGTNFKISYSGSYSIDDVEGTTQDQYWTDNHEGDVCTSAVKFLSAGGKTYAETSSNIHETMLVNGNYFAENGISPDTRKTDVNYTYINTLYDNDVTFQRARKGTINGEPVNEETPLLVNSERNVNITNLSQMPVYDNFGYKPFRVYKEAYTIIFDNYIWYLNNYLTDNSIKYLYMPPMGARYDMEEAMTLMVKYSDINANADFKIKYSLTTDKLYIEYNETTSVTSVSGAINYTYKTSHTLLVENNANLTAADFGKPSLTDEEKAYYPMTLDAKQLSLDFKEGREIRIKMDKPLSNSQYPYVWDNESNLGIWFDKYDSATGELIIPAGTYAQYAELIGKENPDFIITLSFRFDNAEIYVNLTNM